MPPQPIAGKFPIESQPGPSTPELSVPFEDDSRNASHDDKPTQKRNACNVCRKRKLRCDGGFPACGRCTRLKHDCEYSERRRKSGPRRGYVKVLETRLAQVESLLKEKDETIHSEFILDTENHQYMISKQRNDHATQSTVFERSHIIETQEMKQASSFTSCEGIDDEFLGGLPMNDFSWDMMELGVEEPLPPQELVDELTETYFSKIHPTTPMIHKSRYLSTMNLSPQARPSVSLRYAMWTLAASVTDHLQDLQTLFYFRARKYVEVDERSSRQKYINIRHPQALLLLAVYESKMMHFPTSWLTIGRATRLTQMMGLHRLDGVGTEAKQSLPGSTDWSEKEERRRTFWNAYCMDRYSSVGTGWPVVIDERDITTNLPSSEEAFTQGEEVESISLQEAMENPLSASKISSFAGTVIICSLSGSILMHLHRPTVDNNDHDLNGHFWKNHRKIDNILLSTSLCLPSHLRLPTGLTNANTIFLNMSLHAGTICLHQDAIYKAELLEVSSAILVESKGRCLTAATEICSIMKSIAHFDLSMLHVYTPFVLYLATRVFGQIWKTSPDDDNARSSIRFLLSAMLAMQKYTPLSESYLIQLDLEGFGLTAIDGKYSVVEKGVGNMSLTDTTEESSWVTYVSPLVRIAGTSSSNTPASTTSPELAKSSSPEESIPSQPNAPIGAGNLPPRSQFGVGGVPATNEYFSTTENWDQGETGVPSGLFDPMSDGMDTNFWDYRQV